MRLASPRFHLWGVTPRLVALPAVALLVLAALPDRSSAQDSTQLTLLDRIDEPGTNPSSSGDPLPEGTRFIVLPSAAEEGDDPPKKLEGWQVERLDFPADSALTLAADGRTPGRYAKTGSADQVYYVAALTPDSTLYQSYVNSGAQGEFQPGYDAVASGRMRMGPVQGSRTDNIAETLRSALSRSPSKEAPRKEESHTTSKTTAASSASSDGGGWFSRLPLGWLPSGMPWWGWLTVGALLGGPLAVVLLGVVAGLLGPGPTPPKQTAPPHRRSLTLDNASSGGAPHPDASYRKSKREHITELTKERNELKRIVKERTKERDEAQKQRDKLKRQVEDLRRENGDPRGKLEERMTESSS
jgi:FtsZ-binding cell division protein ZapB